MKAIAKPLKKATDKVSQADYDRIYKLYQEKKSQITLDGKKRVVISRLSSKFPTVSIAGSGQEIEFTSEAIEKILSTTCKFKS